MTDQLSVVARALWDAGPENQDPLGVILVEYFDGYTLEEIKPLVLPVYAKAAIEAMLMPTDFMMEAGLGTYGHNPDMPDEEVEQIWQVMVLASLEGKE